MIHIDPCQSLYSSQSLSCIGATQAKLQAHAPEYSHISSATLKTYGKAHHSLSSPFWDLQCMARPCFELDCLELFHHLGTSGFPWTEFLVALGIMGLWISDYRTLPMSTKHLSGSKLYTSWEVLHQTM